MELRDELRGKFWTDREELISDIEKLGYDVIDINDEVVVVENEDEVVTLDLVVARNTIAIL